MEFNQESHDQEINEESESSDTKQWFQDNLRIIISILIVVLIAGGIYSYSKRTEAPELSSESIINNEEGQKQGEIGSGSQIAQEKVSPAVKEEKTSSVAISQETENSFIETAVKGDSKTKLARKALANYLEKNPDTSLTAEHKIYIEDYLRKNVKSNSRILVGTSVEFSKDAVSNAITKSKMLNEKQLQNLHKYVVRVPSLS